MSAGAAARPGHWWSATDQRPVGYESWLERDHLAAFDFDPEVVAIASQPFWLFWTSEAGKTRSHAPDYVPRRGAGSAVVVDCRAGITGNRRRRRRRSPGPCRLGRGRGHRHPLGPLAAVQIVGAAGGSWKMSA